MSLDKMREIWKEEGGPSTMRVDREWLMGMVRRRQRDFNLTILRRDVVEVSVALFCAAFFIFCGIKSESVWGHSVGSLYLLSATDLWVAGFLVVDRFRWKKRASYPPEPSTAFLDRSGSEIEHQIWLLKNVLWWYLLPPAAGILCVFVQVFLQAAWVAGETGGLWVLRGTFTGAFMFTLLVFYGVYHLNQRCVRKDLEPRRHELVELRQNLNRGESPDSV
jgi:hypothetical protein